MADGPASKLEAHGCGKSADRFPFAVRCPAPGQRSSARARVRCRVCIRRDDAEAAAGRICAVELLFPVTKPSRL